MPRSRSRLRRRTRCLLAVLCCTATATATATAGAAGVRAGDARQAAEVPRIVLDNGTLTLELTSSLGGRVLGLHRDGEPNFLQVGDAVRQQPTPRVDAAAEDIGYLGHDVWVGPQADWWRYQQVNPQRRAAAANWPPDPYLAFATTTIEQRTPEAVTLRGIASPVSGVRLRKHVALSRDRADTIELQVEARNIRQQDIAWDLWFNTRVHADTAVFVPVARREDIRVQRADAATLDEPAHAWNDGMLVLSSAASPQAQRGKLLLQPSAGWMAGFRGRQALVIRFAHQPLARIHPDQGQVELYLDTPAGQSGAGLLEMEVHAPYRRLAPDETMQAGEHWTLLRYDGPDDAAARRRFLCGLAADLELHGACASGRR